MIDIAEKIWKKARNIRRYIMLAMLALLAMLTGQAADVAASEAYSPYPQESGFRLPVFETADIHGYIVDTSKENREYRLAFIADKVDDARAATDTDMIRSANPDEERSISSSGNPGEKRSIAGSENQDDEKSIASLDNPEDENACPPRADTVILLDAGDIYQGNTASNLLEGEPLSQAFDVMRYDAVTVGNHEFDWGIENVVDSDATMMDYLDGDEEVVNRIPVVISNLYRDGSKVDFAKDYVILDKTAVNDDGEEMTVRVAVIGFASDYASSILRSMFTDEGYEIREEFDQLENLAAQLKTEGECDAVIVLTHSEAAYIAQNLQEDSCVDLVLGGHTHYNVSARTESGIPYAQPAGQAGAYVYAELVFDRDSAGMPVLRKTSGLKTVSTLKKREKLYASEAETNAGELNQEVLAISDEALEELEEVFDETLGYITVTARRQVFDPESGGRSSVGGNWHASLMARAVDAQIGFFNLYGMREDLVIPAGAKSRDVTVADVLTMFPFGNRICCFQLTGEELLKVFEYSMTEGGATLFSVMTGMDCYFTENGVNALVMDDELLYWDGRWYDGHENDQFLVATNEFVSTTDREENGLHNPLCQWMETDRLLSCGITDAEGALKVLRAEGEQNNGLLSIDTQPHFICREYDGYTGTDDAFSTQTPVLTPETELSSAGLPEEASSDNEAAELPAEPAATDEPTEPSTESAVTEGMTTGDEAAGLPESSAAVDEADADESAQSHAAADNADATQMTRNIILIACAILLIAVLAIMYRHM